MNMREKWVWWFKTKVPADRVTAWRDMAGFLHYDEETCRRVNKQRLGMLAKEEISELLKSKLYKESTGKPSELDGADAVVNEYSKPYGGIDFLVSNLDLWPKIKEVMDGYELSYKENRDGRS